MLSKYKHISFDLDGTLVHTVPEYRYKLVPQVINQLGGTVPDNHIVDRFWFEAGRDDLIKKEFRLNPEDFWKLFVASESLDERAAHTRVYDDVEQVLHKIKQLDKTISVITGAPHKIAELEVAKMNGAPCDFYMSIYNAGFDRKPDPASFHFVLEKLNFAPHETVYIGNSNEDAYFAKNAGVDFIYLERKEHDFDLEDYSVAIIHSLEELFK